MNNAEIAELRERVERLEAGLVVALGQVARMRDAIEQLDGILEALGRVERTLAVVAVSRPADSGGLLH